MLFCYQHNYITYPLCTSYQFCYNLVLFLFEISYIYKQMNKRSKRKEANNKTQVSPERSLSLTSFFSKAATVIKQKTQNSIVKLQQKLAETPTVFVLPLKNRKISQTQSNIAVNSNLSDSRSKSRQPNQKSKSELSQADEERLKILFKKKQELMLKLKKIDQQLQNPVPIPFKLQQQNTSHLSNEHMKSSQLRPIESRLNFNKQNNEVNLIQHQKTIEMLTRINNQKMRRQQKFVNELKKKQEVELKSIQQLEKNKSVIFNERQEKIALIRNINKKETEKLWEPSIIPSTNRPSEIRKQSIQNQFDELQDRQIGSHQRINTEEVPPDIFEINQ